MSANISIITDVPLFCNIFIPLLSNHKDLTIDIYKSIDDIEKRMGIYPCHLILIDGEMSNVSSFEVLQYIRNTKCNKTEIWFFTGIQTEEYILQAMVIGANKIIYRPLDPIAIANEIKEKALSSLLVHV